VFYKFSCVFQCTSLCVFGILVQKKMLFCFAIIPKHISNIERERERERERDVIQASFNSIEKTQTIEKLNQTILKSLKTKFYRKLIIHWFLITRNWRTIYKLRSFFF
jgi:hypothetical protein